MRRFFEFAERIGVTSDGVKYHLRKLKADGVIRRVGSDRAGRWLVVSQKTARKLPESSQKTARKEGRSPETPSLSDRILAFLRQNPSAGRREIAATLGTTPSIVRYRLDKLRAAGKIERVGPDKGGYWKVLGESAVEPDAARERHPRSSR